MGHSQMPPKLLLAQILGRIQRYKTRTIDPSIVSNPDLPYYQTLKKQMKELEDNPELDSSRPIIINASMTKYVDFINGLQRPIDTLLSRAMELTLIDAVKKFNASIGHTYGNRITLVVPAKSSDWDAVYGGRLHKIISMVSVFTTMRFTQHFGNLVNDTVEGRAQNPYYDVLVNKMHTEVAFSATAFNVDVASVHSYMLWRVRYAINSSKLMFNNYYCMDTVLELFSSRTQISKERGYDWEECSDSFKYGVLAKKIQYNEIVNGFDVQKIKVVSFASALQPSDSNLVIRKYLNRT